MRKILFVLGELHDSDLQWMIDAGTIHDAAEGEVLIEEGVPNKRLLIVIDGEVSVRKKALAGAEISRLGIGEMAGDISLLDSRPSTATLQAVGATRVFVIEHPALLGKMERDTGFAARFYRAVGIFLADRLQRAEAMAAAASGAAASEDGDDGDELSPELMDSVSLSGARFLSFLSRLEDA